MKLAEFLAAERGRCAEVAKLAGIAPAYLSQIANGVRPAATAHCAAIEVATGGAVRRWDLRPDDWHRVWPELVGTDGAPTPVVGHLPDAPRREPLMPGEHAAAGQGRRSYDHLPPERMRPVAPPDTLPDERRRPFMCFGDLRTGDRRRVEFERRRSDREPAQNRRGDDRRKP